MKLKTKLIITLLIVILMPVLLLALTVWLAPQLGRDDATILTIVIIALAVTAFILATWLYASFIRPISELQRATREISRGNLDYELKIKRRDEIGDLCRDFEEMRGRLRETAEEKMRIDEDHRMLLSNISHDLRTPITAIKGYAGGILDGVARDQEKLDKYARTIYNKACDMDSLIDELTIYSKIETSRIPYNFRTIDAEEFFGGYAREISDDLDSQGIALTYYNYLEQPTKFVGDEEQLRRVLNNIVSNSVKYMDKKKGFMAIRIRDEGDSICVEIEDNGRGIAKKDLPFIFDRFYRTDASRNSGTGGSGIGLSIVKKIIEDHGGRIWATGDLGAGTVMHFVLRKYTGGEK